PGRCADRSSRTSRSRGREVGRLLQDLLDPELAAPALVRPLLVMADDHLAQQAEGEELDPDDDEQHAEDEQRALADRSARDLDAREVDEDPCSAQPEQEAKPAEEVERTVAVPAQERDGKQVEESAHVALDA